MEGESIWKGSKEHTAIKMLKIKGTQQQSWWFCICGQSLMLLATPQGVGTVWHSQRAYIHRKAANRQSFYFNWGAHDLSLVFTRLLIQAFPKTIFYKSVSRILFICRFCFFYWTLKLFWTPRLYRGFSRDKKTGACWIQAPVALSNSSW